MERLLKPFKLRATTDRSQITLISSTKAIIGKATRWASANKRIRWKMSTPKAVSHQTTYSHLWMSQANAGVILCFSRKGKINGFLTVFFLPLCICRKRSLAAGSGFRIARSIDILGMENPCRKWGSFEWSRLYCHWGFRRVPLQVFPGCWCWLLETCRRRGHILSQAASKA